MQATEKMTFGCAITREPDTRKAARALVEEVRCRLDRPCDLAVLFFTPHHIEGLLEVLDRVHDRLHPRCLIGCSAEGVIGDDQEVERQPAISLLAGSLPGVRVQPFHLAPGDWRPLLKDPDKLEVLARPAEDTRAWIVLGDPYTTPVNEMIRLLECAAPGRPIIGGMASGGAAGQNILIVNDRLHTAGAAGLTLSGPIQVDTVVSQGCRPIGRPYVVTAAEDNMLLQLGGKSALDAAREAIDTLVPDEREQLEEAPILFLGIATNEYKAEFGRDDFLVRSLIGCDPDTGAIGVAGEVEVGQTVQFEIRDAAAADEDLRILMKRQGRGIPPSAALLFSCNGRGQRLFDRPSHDVMAVLDAVPTTPVAGFFAAGELGPVGGRSFIHGQTASVALLRPLPDSD